MRKSIVIALAIAIIGALGIYGKSHSSGASSTTLGAKTNTAQPAATDNSAAKMSSSNSPMGTPASSLKDGSYTGTSQDTPYGTVQIAVMVSGGKITDVNFLQMPNDRGHTQEVTAFAEPLLKQETVGKQNAHIDFVSGATQTSEGYQRSLQSALDQAA